MNKEKTPTVTSSVVAAANHQVPLRRQNQGARVSSNDYANEVVPAAAVGRRRPRPPRRGCAALRSRR